MGEPVHFVGLDNEAFVKEALSIIEKAQAHRACLRILGALAVYVHSLDNSECINALKTLGRLGYEKPMFTDLDLIAYRRQSKDIAKAFQELGFKPNNMLNWWFGDRMMIYNHPENKYHVDVFFDNLAYSHDVKFGDKPGSGRLELDYPTIALEDIVLEKLQPHEMNRKDAVDLIVLLMGHDVNERLGKNVVDGGHVARILSDDWGFWYDATTNLDKVVSLAREFSSQGKLTASQCDTVLRRAGELRRIIDGTPKTKEWNKRAKMGTTKPWFRPVPELMPS